MPPTSARCPLWGSAGACNSWPYERVVSWTSTRPMSLATTSTRLALTRTAGSRSRRRRFFGAAPGGQPPAGQLPPPPVRCLPPGIRRHRAGSGWHSGGDRRSRTAVLAGVQWHPENGDDHGLFAGLVEAAARLGASAEEMESRIVHRERSHRTRRVFLVSNRMVTWPRPGTPHPAATMIIMFDVRAGYPSRRGMLRRRYV